MESIVHRLELELKQKAAEHDTLQQTYDEYIESSKELEAEMEHALEQSDAKVKDLTRRKEAAEEKCSELQAKLASVMKESNKLQESYSKLKDTYATLEKAKKSIEADNEVLEGKVRILETTVEDLEHKLLTFEEENFLIKQDLEDTLASKSEEAQQHEVSHKSPKSPAGTGAGAETISHCTPSRVMDPHGSRGQLIETTTLREKEGKLRALEEQMQSLSTELKNAIEEKEKLLTAVTQNEETIASLRKQLEASSKSAERITELKSSEQSLLTKLYVSTKEIEELKDQLEAKTKAEEKKASLLEKSNEKQKALSQQISLLEGEVAKHKTILTHGSVNNNSNSNKTHHENGGSSNGNCIKNEFCTPAGAGTSTTTVGNSSNLTSSNSRRNSRSMRLSFHADTISENNNNTNVASFSPAASGTPLQQPHSGQHSQHSSAANSRPSSLKHRRSASHLDISSSSMAPSAAAAGGGGSGGGRSSAGNAISPLGSNTNSLSRHHRRGNSGANIDALRKSLLVASSEVHGHHDSIYHRNSGSTNRSSTASNYSNNNNNNNKKGDERQQILVDSRQSSLVSEAALDALIGNDGDDDDNSDSNHDHEKSEKEKQMNGKKDQETEPLGPDGRPIPPPRPRDLGEKSKSMNKIKSAEEIIKPDTVHSAVARYESAVSKAHETPPPPIHRPKSFRPISSMLLSRNASAAALVLDKASSLSVRAKEVLQSNNPRLIGEELLKQVEETEKAKASNISLLNKLQALRGNIQVCCRFRPPNDHEIAHEGKVCIESAGDSELLCFDSRVEAWKSFVFDRVWNSSANQVDVFADVEPLVVSVADGFNACILAYGQTGSGKTYTMDGYGSQYGVSYRTMQKIFDVLEFRRQSEVSKAAKETQNQRKNSGTGGIVGRGGGTSASNNLNCSNDSMLGEDDEAVRAYGDADLDDFDLSGDDDHAIGGSGTGAGPPAFAFTVEMSMMEIYNDQVFDLLAQSEESPKAAAAASNNNNNNHHNNYSSSNANLVSGAAVGGVGTGVLNASAVGGGSSVNLLSSASTGNVNRHSFNFKRANNLSGDHTTTATSAAGAAGTGANASGMTTTAAGVDLKPLEVRTNPDGMISVPGLNSVRVRSMQDAMATIGRGASHRATTATIMNEHSSRSHLILSIDVVTSTHGDTPVRGKMILVDLAGSERVDKSGVKGTALKEAQHINKSLAALGDVMEALDKRSSHIPYRNSKLTYLLQNCLAQNARTMMIVTVCPTDLTFEETLFTLQFATRIRNINLGAIHKTSQSKNLEIQLKSLKTELRDAKKAQQALESQLNSTKKDQKKIVEKSTTGLEAKMRQVEESRKAAELQASSLHQKYFEANAKLHEEKVSKEKISLQLVSLTKTEKLANEEARESKKEVDRLLMLLKAREKELETLKLQYGGGGGGKSHRRTNTNPVSRPVSPAPSRDSSPSRLQATSLTSRFSVHTASSSAGLILPTADGVAAGGSAAGMGMKRRSSGSFSAVNTPSTNAGGGSGHDPGSTLPSSSSSSGVTAASTPRRPMSMNLSRTPNSHSNSAGSLQRPPIHNNSNSNDNSGSSGRSTPTGASASGGKGASNAGNIYNNNSSSSNTSTSRLLLSAPSTPGTTTNNNSNSSSSSSKKPPPSASSAAKSWHKAGILTRAANSFRSKPSTSGTTSGTTSFSTPSSAEKSPRPASLRSRTPPLSLQMQMQMEGSAGAAGGVRAGSDTPKGEGGGGGGGGGMTGIAAAASTDSANSMSTTRSGLSAAGAAGRLGTLAQRTQEAIARHQQRMDKKKRDSLKKT